MNFQDISYEKQKAYIREIAIKIAERASSKENFQIIQRWNAVNALKKPDRAPVWCRPVSAWKEILPESSIYCTDAFLRSMEINLRKILCKIDIDDDTPVYNYYAIPTIWRYSPENQYGVDIRRRESDYDRGAWGYVSAIKDRKDIKNLVLPDLSVDEPKTKENMERSFDILGDILPVKLISELPVSVTLGTAAAELRGLEQMMMDTVLDPELMHEIMGYLRDRAIRLLKKAENLGKISPNNYDAMFQSCDFGPEPEGGSYSLKNCWCAANSQEFDQVSPQGWEEFCLEYQKPIFELFGYVAYGCCENLTRKVDGILSIPNLRILVCSAWTNLDLIIEKAKKDYVIMWRQKASDVLYPDDEQQIKLDLLEGCRKLQNSNYQIVLREIETLFGHSRRLHDWTKYAKEAAERFA